MILGVKDIEPLDALITPNGRSTVSGQFVKGNTFGGTKNLPSPKHRDALMKAKLALVKEQLVESITKPLNGDSESFIRRVIETTLASKPEAVLQHLGKFLPLVIEKGQQTEQRASINIAGPQNVNIVSQ